jgi:hypothetical protein
MSSNRQEVILKNDKNYTAEITGQGELLVSLSSNGAKVLVSAVKTPNMIRVTGAGTIASNCTSISVANAGNASGTFLGVTLKASEGINFDAGAIGNYFAAGTISYDGTGTELLIIYIV